MPEDPRQPPKNQESRLPVIWTPEDAANFLSAAIKEAQRPLAQALQRQGIPPWAFGLIIIVTVAAICLGWLHFDEQLKKAWQRNTEQFRELQTVHAKADKARDDKAATAEALRQKYDSIVEQNALAQGELAARKRQQEELEIKAAIAEKVAAEAQKELRQQRAAAEERIAMLQQDYEKMLLRADKENGSQAQLRQELDQANSQKSSAAQETENLRQQLAEARKQVDLLKQQLVGMDEERQALRKQLQAAQAMLTGSAGNTAPSETPPETKAETHADE